MITASGILFVSKKGTALFLKRGSGSDSPGCWCFPGGHQEEGETLEECAVREAKEECGHIPAGKRRLWTRAIANRQIAGQTPQPTSPPVPAPVDAAVGNTPAQDSIVIPAEQVDFTTFIQQVDEEFPVEVDGEHVGWAWAPLNNPPEPLHPGCRVAIDRLTMNELGVAEAIRDGRLTSPQFYDNMWLFALRITGTGLAYRHEKKDDKGKVLSNEEFVWREPELYMNEDFMRRCNGLSIIMEHPGKGFLTSKEFDKRAIGSVFLPYLKHEKNEVWGIGKIYDAEAAMLMRSEQLSTSPCVVFRNPEVNNKIETEDGKKLLMEGEPSLVDHLAVCYRGVWDKLGEPEGVQNDDLVVADSVDEPISLVQKTGTVFLYKDIGTAFELLSIHSRAASARR